MKRIALLPVGGTICTALRAEGDLAVNEGAALWLMQAYEQGPSPFGKEVEFLPGENLKILSETMTVERWNRMRDSLEALDREGCQGVIVLHGTDTLAYSAAIFAFLWQGLGIPVVFVSANRPLASPFSNGHENFRAAVESICLGLAPNVYAVYQNPSDGVCYLHLASRLEQCRSYSEDFFSWGMAPLPLPLGERSKAVAEWNERFPPQSRGISWSRAPLKPCVAQVMPYVGLDYSRLSLEGCEAVLHLSYHSGTVCVGEEEPSSVLSLLNRCAESFVECYVFPARREGEVYESVTELCLHEAPLRFLWGCSAECAYAKLVLAYSLLAPEEREGFLQGESNYEFFA